jgi:serine/threonine-protein kinase RsbW
MLMGAAGPQRREESNGRRSTPTPTPRRPARANGASPANGRPRAGHAGGAATAATAAVGRAPMKHSFTIPSDFTACNDIQLRIMEDVEQNGFDSESIFAIRIALEEALVNAVRHGNRLDPRKKVHVEAEVTRGRAEIVVEDEGPGFDRGTVPDPTADENLCRPSGRGILLIESYMSDVSWERGGRRLRMVKHAENE